MYQNRGNYDPLNRIVLPLQPFLFPVACVTENAVVKT